MKKYHGKKDWTESLYYAIDYDLETGTELESGGFYLSWINVEDGSFLDTNFFDDTNDFITYSEVFNVFQLGKI